MELIPVIEFEPFQFASLECADWSDVAARNQYWLDCLAQSGIEDLAPVREGSWMVPVQRICDEHHFTALVEKLYGEDWEEEDGWRPIPGGCVFHHEDHWISPQCCGDLTGLKEWAIATEHPCQEWTMIWIGHPWVEYRWSAKDQIEISDLLVGDSNPAENCVRLPVAELKTAISPAEKII